MKIIYSCYGGAHSSITAAAIHTGILPNDRIPSKEEILAVPFYDETMGKDIGRPIHMGVDEWNNDVYVVGMGSNREMHTKMIYEFANEFNDKNQKDIMIIKAIDLINTYVRFGGLLSRRLNIISLGRPLTVYGMRKNFMLFIELVNNVKQTLSTY